MIRRIDDYFLVSEGTGVSGGQRGVGVWDDFNVPFLAARGLPERSFGVGAEVTAGVGKSV